MTINEFLNFLEKNLISYNIFIEKATEYQLEKNKKRTPKKRWEEKKVNRAINEMWKSSMQVAYEKVKTEIGIPRYDGYEKWIEFIEENDFLEAINDSITELEFE
ncbi:hypothetical protein P7H62_14420 [Vagococcus carniphilus]|uniref:hypothetical protein n=1 Tax=Vagococcus carniphilus TaxID=218144 RepID=UPI0028902599|nr:hypothetical protein [Vagococcus carniphilus]MDT2830061.1 hypothetical protein [Vagococcus carniphilus]MDT2838495.1 hypothetical protein [Vagococcus carniphilus]MDT2855657.1 hypothetical protein [Vagococcus carniphilus]